jgi:hypothetical protein
MDGDPLVRLVFTRALAAIYAIAFVSALNQFRPLLGERGLLPAPAFLQRTRFWATPSIFHLHYSDRFFVGVASAGLGLAIAILVGALDLLPWWGFGLGWLTMWALYLSIVNVGQDFYAFGWESMLLEAGFFAAFLGPAHLQAPFIPILALRWMLFRTEVGAGLIKLRGDRCWRDLTCLYYHHETQPMPNPLSAWFHHLPRIVLRGGVVFSHFVQVVVPFGLFLPQPIPTIAAILIAAHQLALIVGGNYSWLNWLTVVLAVTGLDLGDRVLDARPTSFEVALALLLALTVALSIRPALNLVSRHQAMNHCWNAFHLVCAYGAFGAVTKERLEIVIEGTRSTSPDDGAVWEAYEFKGKPGDPRRRPPQVAPYHLRLDWSMWFLPFSVRLGRHGGVVSVMQEWWFLRLVEKLLEGDRPTRRLLSRRCPFGDAPPALVRASLYRYELASPKEHRATGAWWRRVPIGLYLSPMARKEPMRGAV